MPTFGDTTPGTSEFPMSGDRCIVDRFNLVENANITYAYAHVGGSSGGGDGWVFVIHEDLAGAPGPTLYTSNATTVPAFSGGTWLQFSFSGTPSLTPGDYWLGVVCDGAAANSYLGEDNITAGSDPPDVNMANGTYSFATPPSDWPGSDVTYDSVRLNVYVEYTTSSGVSVAWLRA